MAKVLANALVFGTALCATRGGIAQIVADASAPENRRAAVVADRSGRPVVHIHAPSAAGVSRNVFSRFDVRGDGVVLDNARGSNPLLGKEAARVILNEVNSSAPSQLQGPVAVQGSSAHVVIANPAGLQIDGARFINASRVTLTTGVPIVENGAFRRVDVRQGLVEVSGKGLDVSATPYTEILSRAARIAARIDAQALHVVTGTQEVDPNSGALKPLSGLSGAPAVAIDTVALGGMHAQSIFLMATEAGVGVRNAGILRADGQRGDLVITSAGRLENTGHLEARGDVRVSGSEILMRGRGPRAGRAIEISAGGDLRIEASQAASGDADLGQNAGPATQVAEGDITLQAAADIFVDGLHAQSGGRLRVSAGRDLRVDGLMPDGHANVSTARITLARSGQADADGDPVSADAPAIVPSMLAAVHGVTLGAAGDLSMTGSQIRAERGLVHLKARGMVEMKAGRDWRRKESASERGVSDLLGIGETITAVTDRHTSRTVRHAVLQGLDVRVEAEKGIRVYGSDLAADRRLTLEAGGDIEYLAARTQEERLETRQLNRRLLGAGYHRTSHADRSDMLSRKSVRLHGGEEVVSRSGGSQSLQGTEISHGRAAVFEAGTGAQARLDARLVLSSAFGSETRQSRSTSNQVVWEADADRGSVVETASTPTFSEAHTIKLTAPGGLEVQLPVSAESVPLADAVGDRPGMHYLKDLTRRSDVSWQRLTLASSQWQESRQGLTTAGEALLTTGVFWGTTGMGAALIGLTPGGVLGTAANFAFSRYASVSAVAFVNNGADPQATLTAMKSVAALKTTGTVGLTAGMMSAFGANRALATLRSTPTLRNRFTYQLLGAAGRSGISTAINGGGLSGFAQGTLRDASFLTVQGTMLGQISGMTLDPVSRKLGYALIGCATGAAGMSSCASGALGSVATDIAFDALAGKHLGQDAASFDPLTYEARVIGLGKTIAGVIAAYGGGNATEAVQAAEISARQRGFR